MRYCRYLVLSSATARWRIGLGCRTSFLIKAFGRSRIFATISKRIAARCLIRTGAMPANRLRKKGLRPRLLTKSDWSRYNDRWNVTRESSEGASPAQWRRGRIVSNGHAPARSCRTSIVCVARLSNALSFLRPPRTRGVNEIAPTIRRDVKVGRGEQHVMQSRSIRRSGQPKRARALSNASF